MRAALPLPRNFWRLLFWAQLAVVTWLMLVPQPPPVADTGWDKLNHVLAFAGPCFAGLAALPRADLRRGLLLGAALVAFGGGLELLQGLLPPRNADWADLLADALGVLLGAAAYVGATRAVARFGASARA